ncbi:trypsin [Kordia periserrulae]|uniref:Trypsin n=1 Tax=Kordia periserrulae TaxID=701523 RepID=A0A2T6BTY4_9FLAO|nr:trypsin-like serine protease [Kordia periserrulae]PTX59541.1 trypsin [Kordia periserrulae]
MTWSKANSILHRYAESLLKTEEIQYLAIVNDADSNNDNDFALELGVSFDIPTQLDRPSTHIGFQNPAFYSSKRDKIDSYNKELFINLPEIEPINEITIRKVNKISSQSTIPVEQGNRIKSSNKVNKGTIGALVRLDNYPDDYFILSNWHVLMDDSGDMSHNILDDHKNVIAEPFWGINNKYYDIALAKIIPGYNVEQSYETASVRDYNSIKLGMDVEKFEYIGPRKVKKIISSNAFVKVYTNDTTTNYKIYKNQILVEKVSVSGDSGSVILSSDSKDVIGLIFAGDSQNVTVCNHLHLLANFDNIIPKYLYQYGKNSYLMPEISFRKLLINKSFSE